MNIKIIVEHVLPPIPIRAFDWRAYRDGTEESGPFVWGSTRETAIEDLRFQLEEDEQ